MALSEEETRILAEMEQQFSPSAASDPATKTSAVPAKSVRISPRAIACGVLLALLGLVLLLAGVIQGYNWHGILTGVIGFAVLLGGVVLPRKYVPGQPRRRV